MKTPPLIKLIAAFAAIMPSLVQADVVQGDPAPSAGIPYFWTVTLGANESGFGVSHVGAWSWEDDSLFDPGLGEPPVGWTHTSNWVALTLLSPATFTFRLERQAGVPWPSAGDPGRVASIDSMFPSFTIWANQDNDGDDFHTYNNRGNVDWAEDLSYLDHADNSTLEAIERSWNLPAGEYTIVLGSNATATDTNRQGYRATFTTAPVPEPTTTALVLLSLGAVFLVRRKRRVRVMRSRLEAKSLLAFAAALGVGHAIAGTHDLELARGTSRRGLAESIELGWRRSE